MQSSLPAAELHLEGCESPIAFVNIKEINF